MKIIVMMTKVISHQPISEAPLDEERRESRRLTPENPKEGKVPAARIPPLKGQYVCHSRSIVGLCRRSYRLYETKLTAPLSTPIVADTAITGHQEEEDPGVGVGVQAGVPDPLRQPQQRRGPASWLCQPRTPLLVHSSNQHSLTSRKRMFLLGTSSKLSVNICLHFIPRFLINILFCGL